MTTLKNWFFIILALIMLVPCLLWFTCSDKKEQPEVIVDTWSDSLTSTGFEKAIKTQEPRVIDELPEFVEAIGYASGVVNEQELEISIVETPDNEVWIKATLDGNEVKIRRFEWRPQPVPVKNNDFSLIIAGEMIDSFDLGVGVAYQPFELFGVDLGLQGVVDINQDLGESPDWASLGIRGSKSAGAFSLGGHLGYRFGEEQGVSVGVDVGVSVGI